MNTQSRVLTLSGDDLDGSRVLSVMHAPEDEKFRRSFMAVQMVRGYEWDLPGAPVIIERELIADLLHAPAWETLSDEIKARHKDGIVAGYVMISLFLMWRYPHLHGRRTLGGVSLNKAFHFCGHLGQKLRWQYGDGSVLPGGETKIKQCWSEYRTVAHLWAAHVWHAGFPLFDGEKNELYRAGLPAFLGGARYFEFFGRESVLDKKATKAKEKILPVEHWLISDSVRAILPLPNDLSVLNDSPIANALASYSAK